MQHVQSSPALYVCLTIPFITFTKITSGLKNAQEILQISIALKKKQKKTLILIRAYG